MKKLVLSLKGRKVCEFSSTCQFLVYIIDIFIKLSIISLVTFSGIIHEFISAAYPELSRYIYLYIISLLVWGLLLLKFAVSSKIVFSKTKFDMFYMGLLTFFLISVLMTKEKIAGVFGTNATWSYSIITILSISVIYYVIVLIFNYTKGIKWLSLAFLFSLIIPSIFYLFKISQNETVKSLDYLKYAVLSIPLSISLVTIYKKVYLKVIAFLGVVLNLFLIAFYSEFLSGTIFILSAGVLCLFLLFYFYFWVKNSNTIYVFFKDLRSKVKNIKDLRNMIQKDKKEFSVFLMTIFMAVWIIGFSIFSYRFFSLNIKPFIFDWYSKDLGKIQGIGMWLIGKNDLTREFSSIEIINILANYGIFAVVIYIGYLIYTIYISGKLTLKLLNIGTFRNIILLSGIFVTLMSVFVNLLLSRFTPMVLILFIYSSGMLAIICDIFDKKNAYYLVECSPSKSKLLLILRIIISLFILSFIVLGSVGILKSLDTGLFV